MFISTLLPYDSLLSQAAVALRHPGELADLVVLARKPLMG